jgi:hypothetical protein
MQILTGMHRSGTSLAARLLQQAGADLGDPAGFYPANRWNPDGYFELNDIIWLNRRLLHGLLGRFAYFYVPSEDTMRRRGRNLTDKLQEADRRFAGKLLKDPRFTITAPIWEENGVKIEKLLICIREPMEVADSLRRRNWITRRTGLKFWEQHNRRLLAFVEGRNVWWIRYSRLIDPATGVNELTGAVRYLGLPIDESSGTELVRSVVRSRPGQPPESPPSYPPSVKNLWAELCARHARQMEQ